MEQPNTKRKVPVIHAYYVTKYLGQLWLDFDEAGEVVKSYGNPILLDSSVEQGKHNNLYNVIKYFRLIWLIVLKARLALKSSKHFQN